MSNVPVTSSDSPDLWEENQPVSRYRPARTKNEAPVAASFCAHFLKPDMQHIYRQITALRRFRPYVLTQQRENVVDFPFPDVRLIRKPWTHRLRRFWAKSVLNLPVQAYPHEASRILSELEKINARVLHIYLGGTAIYLLPLLRRQQIPAIVSFHGSDATAGGVNKSLRSRYQELFSVADLILARSQAMLTSLENLGCPPEKLRLHRTGVSLALNAPIIRTLPLDGDFRFVQACRLVERKGIDLAIRAFAVFAAEFPMAEFIIAGEGPLKKRLAILAKELGLEERVHFPGFLPQKTLHELYERSHVFVQPGLSGGNIEQEGVPNAMLEAMATGMPVIGTPTPSTQEAVADGQSGLLVPEKDLPALTEAFLRVGRDGILLQELSQGAVAHVKMHFDRGKQARLLEELYEEAIQLQKNGQPNARR